MVGEELRLNRFEMAILDRLAESELLAGFRGGQIRVLRRQLTGAGSYTDFDCLSAGGAETYVGLEALINMPGVPNGMGATLHLKGQHPHCLEVFTYGGESWDGGYEGFSIEEPA